MEGIIFDFNGTLIKDYPINILSWKKFDILFFATLNCYLSSI